MRRGKNKNFNEITNQTEKLNRIVEGTEIKGDIITDGNFRLDGKLIGTIKSCARLVIGNSGVIEGKVKCENAEIEGTVNGNIFITDCLTLKSTANVRGNITAGKISFENGAIFNGNCNIGKDYKISSDVFDIEEKEQRVA